MILGLLYYRHKVKQHRRQAKREVREYLDSHDYYEWEVWYEVCDHDPHEYCELCT